jgi:DNA-directed RNA polymerase specialized sigma24 family protein
MNVAGTRDFQAFADAASTRLLPVAYALTGNQRAAEQLVTRALARVARDRHRLDGDLATHATRFLYRAYVDSRPTDGPLELYALDEPAEALRRLRNAALRLLPPRQRALLVMRYLEQRSDEEAADLLGGTAGALGAAIDAARDRLEALYASVTGSAGDAFDAENGLPLMLRELADAAEPAALAPAALASARRQRRTRIGVTAGAPVVVLALVAGVAIAWPRQSPPPDPTGLTVITSYQESGGVAYVLNTHTGEYDLGSFAVNGGQLSPDLRMWASRSGQGDAMVIHSANGRQPDRLIDLPAPVLSAGWSPDSRRLVIAPFPIRDLPPPDDPNYQEALDRTVYPHFRSVTIVDVETAETAEVALDLPTGHVGEFAAFWVDADRFATSILDTTMSVARGEAFAVDGDDMRPPRVSVGIFDLTGALVAEIRTIPDDGEAGVHTGLIWEPTGLVRGDQLLLERYPEPGVLELAVADLSAPGTYETVSLTVPDVTEPQGLGLELAYPFAWLPDGRVLVAPPHAVDEPVATVSIVDLETGAVREANLATELPSELPIPPTATDLTFADADPLPPDAAHLAFLPGVGR